MNFSSNKEKGNSGLGMAIAYFSTNGYVVSIPLNDTQDYDLVVEKENMLKKVQVKSTGCIEKGEHYQVSLKSCGGTKATWLSKARSSTTRPRLSPSRQDRPQL